MHSDASLVTLRIAVATYFQLKFHITLRLHFIFNFLPIEAFPKKKGLFPSVIMFRFHVLYQYQFFTVDNYE
jgi:hypothetical protein